MDRLRVSFAGLLLKMTFEFCPAEALLCPTCPEGYFLKTNCSEIHDKKMGVQCQLCTDCSGFQQDLLVKCSPFADSVCRNKTTTITTTVPQTVALTTATASPFEPWTVLLGVIVPGILITLLTLILILLSCRFKQQKKQLGSEVLSADHRLLPPCDTP
ncbi:hypothetical protein Q5P01_019398 [Channa striata]|uniref:TNFR-Cys domain-containing protein n=1 Tax=Channa striata TaxID=64152 RepID=A0AA88M1B0_CHASR|nr:hypothetical protein Q5P01_019398 [Channa striata]